jgi:hypothetical protein
MPDRRVILYDIARRAPLAIRRIAASGAVGYGYTPHFLEGAKPKGDAPCLSICAS